ncbi:MAG: hypothetical protein COS37_04745 [Anaerolineae bacterium CG03_land_8_20_14_0_80_58_20]|nr:MAG: hypothetical protein COS37_04745 [Anaerolineae bacterium CG03_land_8_20_14_0_80_58_20]
MEPNQPTAQAIAIQGEMIIAVGTDDEILTLSGPETQIIDLQGQTIMPGFVDAHDHVFNDAGKKDMSMEQSQQMALEYGITTLANMYNPPDVLDEMRAFQQAGKLKIRTSLYLTYSGPCGEIIGDWHKDVAPTRNSGEMLRIGGMKMTADGGVCGKAALSTAYPDGGFGDLWFTQDQINQIVADAQAAGYQVAIHAQGDRAIEQAQNAIAFALNGKPNTYRHRIEHNPFARPDLLSRYSEIGIVPIAFGAYPTCAEIHDSYYSSFFGTEPMPYLENWRAFLDANPGLPVAWHSDWPYASMNTFLNLYSYVTRQEVDTEGNICMPPEWLASHAISVDEALPMMTINAAYALFRETEVGSLKAGKFADLLIISDDPTAINPNDLINLQVWMTMVGGKVEFCADEHASLCPRTEAAASSGPEAGAPSSSGISASASLATDPPENAFDGDTETIWNSGADPDQWIQINLGKPTTVSAIRLVVSQYPAGDTIHQIWGGADENNLTLLHEFNGFTQDPDTLEFKPSTPLSNIQYIKIITTQSPSWVAWREIEVTSP